MRHGDAVKLIESATQLPQAARNGSAGSLLPGGQKSGVGEKPATAVAAAEVLRRQHLVITRKQALACGLTNDMLGRRTRSGGPWQRLLPGVFLAVTGTPTQDQRETAALLYAGPGSTISGTAALRRFGLRVAAPAKIDVLIPAGRRRQNAAFVALHYTRRVPDPVCYEGPIQFALPARAVADAARWTDDLASVRTIVASAVQSRLCSIEQLVVELRIGSRQGSAHFRAALAEVVAGVRSIVEAELRQLIIRARLPEPIFNARLLVGDDLIAIADAWWPDYGVAVEVDSKAWHLLPEHWEQTMARHARMTALGILVLHFAPNQIKSEPEKVIAIIRQTLINRSGRPPLPIRTLLPIG
jgi:very-short-patch-repair endonuclease